MKPTLRQNTLSPDLSFLVRKDKGSALMNNWHYHPEIELIFMKKCAGTLLVGDHIDYFQSGDILLLGSALPHCFKHEASYTNKEDSENTGESICVKFLPGAFGATFFDIPENRKVNQLFDTCGRGLRLIGETKRKTGRLIEKIYSSKGTKRLIFLLYALDIIAQSKELEVLSANRLDGNATTVNTEKIKTIFEYTLQHYNAEISISEVAALVCMTPESFCRYFKNKTQKTYVHFLTEVRIGNACRLLVEEDLTASEISYLCGYNNISHFNHQFKSLKKMSPLAFRRSALNG